MGVILVIDDEPTLLQMVRLMLERAQYTALTTVNPAEGIEIALRELPDAIIVDDRMAEMGGADVCRALRMDSRTAHIPLAIIGANYEISRHAKEAGADAWLGKPFYPIDLIHLVESLLAKGQERAKQEPSSGITPGDR